MAVVDDKTPRLGLLLPFTDNFLQDDVERLRDTFGLLDVLVVTRDKTTGKIADDMLSSVIAKLDAQGKLLTAQIPSSVVQKGPDGKIDASLMPSIAVVDTFPVPNEASMLGLQCERGDIAIREDLGKTFILTQMPPSVLSNWRELTSTNVTSVNGQTGAITGLAKSGVNNDITGLNALSGPLRLGGDAAGDYDAVTLKQLRAASGGAGGASMNGVMNNFIGAVEWFNGTRAKIPAGYIAADGQPLIRTEWPDLWAAVNSGMLNSISEALWNNSGETDYFSNRSCYSMGDGSTSFRAPDLNGAYVHSSQPTLNGVGGVFLSGAAPSRPSGKMWGQTAPNVRADIVGVMAWNAAAGSSGNGLKISNASMNVPATAGSPNTGPMGGSTLTLDLSKGDSTYGHNSTWLYPTNATGLWIIRASGTFQAQNTSFEVFNADTTQPAPGYVARGGELNSTYNGAGVGVIKSTMQAAVAVGGQVSTTYIYTDATGIGGAKGVFSFDSDGRFNAPKATIAGEILANSCRVLGDVALYARSTTTQTDYGPTCRAVMAKTNGGVVKDVSFGFRPEWNKTSNMVYGTIELLSYDGTGTNLTAAKYWKFNKDGTVTSDGAWNAASDRRLKDHVKNIENPLWRVMQLNGVTWDRIDGGRPGQGFIAQELAKIMPTAVSDTGDTILPDGQVIKNTLAVDVAGAAAALHTEAIKSLVELVKLAITNPDMALKELELIQSVEC